MKKFKDTARSRARPLGVVATRREPRKAHESRQQFREKRPLDIHDRSSSLNLTANASSCVLGKRRRSASPEFNRPGESKRQCARSVLQHEFPFGDTNLACPVLDESDEPVIFKLSGLHVLSGQLNYHDGIWSTYRRNYIHVEDCCYSIKATSDKAGETLYLRKTPRSERIPILALALSIAVRSERRNGDVTPFKMRNTGRIHIGEPQIEMVRPHVPSVPDDSFVQAWAEGAERFPLSTGQALGITVSKQSWIRLNYPCATVDNGQRRSNQEMFYLCLSLQANTAKSKTETPDWTVVATCKALPFIVYGRSPMGLKKNHLKAKSESQPTAKIKKSGAAASKCRRSKLVTSDDDEKTPSKIKTNDKEGRAGLTGSGPRRRSSRITHKPTQYDEDSTELDETLETSSEDDHVSLASRADFDNYYRLPVAEDAIADEKMPELGNTWAMSHEESPKVPEFDETLLDPDLFSTSPGAVAAPKAPETNVDVQALKLMQGSPLNQDELLDFSTASFSPSAPNCNFPQLYRSAAETAGIGHWQAPKAPKGIYSLPSDLVNLTDPLHDLVGGPISEFDTVQDRLSSFRGEITPALPPNPPNTASIAPSDESYESEFNIFINTHMLENITNDETWPFRAPFEGQNCTFSLPDLHGPQFE